MNQAQKYYRVNTIKTAIAEGIRNAMAVGCVDPDQIASIAYTTLTEDYGCKVTGTPPQESNGDLISVML